MNYKRLLCGVIGTTVLTTTMSIFALTFSDVESDATVAWAKPYIQQMTDLEYIKGYEDSTFRPSNTISKIESLLLLSRMIGVDEDAYSEVSGAALSEYSAKLSGYSTPYKREVSFLLYNDILNDTDLDTYIANSVANTPLKRYEAAILITKLLGAEDEVKSNAFVSSSYADTVEIPDYARAFVEYVKTVGVMEGMGNDESGLPVFSPNTYVTRAQMAKMLACIIDVLGKTTESGVIVSVDDFNDAFTATVGELELNYEISDKTIIYKEGETIPLSSLKVGDSVKVTHMNGDISLIEVMAQPSEVTGIVNDITDTGGVKKIIIADPENTGSKKTYTLSDDCKVRVNTDLSNFSNIKDNDYVSITLLGGMATEIDVINKSAEVYGNVTDINVDGEKVFIEITNSSDAVKTYEVSGGCSVTRNGSTAEVRDIATGDKITAKTTYGKVTKIVTESTSRVIKGTIRAVTLSDNPTISIESDGSVTTYNIYKNAKVLIDNEESDIYSLRPGTAVSVNLESDEVKTITTTSVASKTEVSGTVKTVNTSYGLIIIESTDGAEENIYVNSKTQYISSASSTADISLKSLKKGMEILVTGSNISGIFEASVIIAK